MWQRGDIMTSKSTRGAAPEADSQYRLIALDPDIAEQTRELARKIAERSGRTVTISDADGEVLGVFERPRKKLGCVSVA
jgi:hypothetical protein